MGRMSTYSKNGLTLDDVWEFFGSQVRQDWAARYYTGEQRIGQAFMNAIPHEAYALLTDSVVDPFYSNNILDVLAAFEYILERK
jgi:hypothetical protein